MRTANLKNVCLTSLMHDSSAWHADFRGAAACEGAERDSMRTDFWRSLPARSHTISRAWVALPFGQPRSTFRITMQCDLLEPARWRDPPP